MKLRPPLRYFGGKYFLCKWIIEQFPEHTTYVEPFGGAASVLLNKPLAEVEVYNDLEYSVYNLFYVLKNHLPDFLEKLEEVSYDKETWTEMKRVYLSMGFKKLPRIQQALVTYCARRMSRGGTLNGFCWSKRKTKGVPEELAGWNSMKKHFPLITDRLEKVRLYNTNAIDMMDIYDSPTTLFYLDPPYLHETRKSKSVYLKEMDRREHILLGEKCKEVKGMVVVSGYPSELYFSTYSGWDVITKSEVARFAHSEKKAQNTEILWVNFGPAKH
jgi:DNA adenine methylase